MQFGMSRMGRVNYKESRSSPFLSGATTEEFGRQYSEKTACEIDAEVRRIVDEAVERVRVILEARRAALVALTNLLIEVESVDGVELKRIIDENSPGPLLVPGTANSARRQPVSITGHIKSLGDDEKSSAVN